MFWTSPWMAAHFWFWVLGHKNRFRKFEKSVKSGFSEFGEIWINMGNSCFCSKTIWFLRKKKLNGHAGECSKIPYNNFFELNSYFIFLNMPERFANSSKLSRDIAI